MSSDGTQAGRRRDRFERVASTVYEPLQRYVRRRCAPDAADDVVADSLLVLWRRLDDVIEANELAWCYGVARRVLANHHRSAARHRRLLDRLTSFTSTETGTSAAEDSAVDDLHVALDELPAADREVLSLWAWEGLEPRDIAVVLDVSPNAAAIRLHRARQRLRSRFDRRKSSWAAGQPRLGHPENG